MQTQQLGSSHSLSGKGIGCGLYSFIWRKSDILIYWMDECQTTKQNKNKPKSVLSNLFDHLDMPSCLYHSLWLPLSWWCLPSLTGHVQFHHKTGGDRTAAMSEKLSHEVLCIQPPGRYYDAKVWLGPLFPIFISITDISALNSHNLVITARKTHKNSV